MGQIIIAEALTGLTSLPDESADMCVTSPPYYGLRDYGASGQIGNENTPEEYIERLVAVFHEVRRVLKSDGTLWVNIADSYSGSGKGSGGSGQLNEKQRSNTGANYTVGKPLSKTKTSCKPKDLIGIPWLLALALRADGWYLRSDIIWDKSGNVFPESIKDRCTKSHEYIFMLAKNRSYYYNADAIKEPVASTSLARAKYGWHGKGTDGAGNYAGLGQVDKMGTRFVDERGRNKRDVWRVNTHSYKEAHFATYPPKLIRPCILAGSRKGGTVLDPFIGSGTTALVALQEGRDYIGIDIQPSYKTLINERIASVQTPFV